MNESSYFSVAPWTKFSNLDVLFWQLGGNFLTKLIKYILKNPSHRHNYNQWDYMWDIIGLVTLELKKNPEIKQVSLSHCYLKFIL